MEPLTPAVFHVLLALAEGEKHGYGIMKEIAERTKQQVTMGPGTLYGTLQRMLETGLVEECGDKEQDRRRYYRLTRNGRLAAISEAERLQKLVSDAYHKAILKRPRIV
jgi:DNA-binding PadR family transcriptional regulator